MLATPENRPSLRSVLGLLLLGLVACDGRRGPVGPPGPPGSGGGGGGGGGTNEDELTDDELERGEVAPRIVLEILAVEGASGVDGSFQVGDRPSVLFRFAKEDGGEWLPVELDFGRALVSGPTFNYQRVIAEREDVLTAAEREGSNRYRYTFPEPLPEHYLAPYHDTPSFGELDGELTDTPLLAGTYTLALALGWRYTLAGEPRVAVGEATFDFRLGGAAELAPRAVSAQANCEACHVDLEAHEGERHLLAACILCHTSGAEDANIAAAGGSTPGQTIDSRVLFHKLHNAAHLPSVLGVGVQASGDKDWAREPRPLVYADAEGELADFSDIGFPVWPNRTIPLLRDYQFSSLGEAARAREEAILRGVTTCRVCHGDPDGDGPLEAPADGELVYAQPSRKACGACHDDVDWTLPYNTNAQTMPPQPDSSQCKICHEPTGGPLAIVDGHRHPLEDVFFNPGLVLELGQVADDGGDGSLDVGEEVLVELSLVDHAGLDVDPALVETIEYVLAGPTRQSNMVAHERIPSGLLTGGSPHAIRLPERVRLEHLGDSTAALDRFASARAPQLDVTGGETVVYARVGLSAGSLLAQAAEPGTNRLVVDDSSPFERDDWIVIDDGEAGEEYSQVQQVEPGLLWLSSPADLERARSLSRSHAAGASIAPVALLELERGLDYALDAEQGEVVELRELGVGRGIVASYTTPFRLPERFPIALNDSPDLGEESGEWSGKPLVPGTYTLTLSASYTSDDAFAGEHNLYAITAPAVARDLLVGGAVELEPYALIASGEACSACHQELHYHDGGQRGFAGCIACHGTAGAEDRPRYVSANAPATEARSVRFRSLLHAIHMGAGLSAPEDLVVVGAGSAPWPDDYSLHTYGSIHFPARLGEVPRCTKCHGEESQAWIAPAPVEHPDGQALHDRAWAQSCPTCHDGPAVQAHVDSQTAANGAEACSICHGPGEDWSVESFHPAR